LAGGIVGLVGIYRLWRTGLQGKHAIKWDHRNRILWYACGPDRSICGLSGVRLVNPCHQRVSAFDTWDWTANDCKSR
jgi:hypothetical protein